MVFGKFDLGCNVGIDVAPYLAKFKERGSSEKCVGGLSAGRTKDTPSATALREDVGQARLL
jgi:hypothetical protein